MRLIRCGTSGLRALVSGLRAVAGHIPRAIATVALAAMASAPDPALAQTDPTPAYIRDTSQAAAIASAWDAPEPWRTDRFYLETSVYTRHFHYDAAHDDHQKLVLGEWNVTEQWLFGASFFDNSFGQPSQYVYGGFRFRPFEALQPLYLKVSAGVVHGYTGEYQDKIPYNNSGFAPVIVPSIGYCFKRYCSEFVIFGGAGFLVTFGVTLP
jgi:hypothetical protein